MKKVLVTGALGQIGSELVMYLRKTYGDDNVISSSRSKKEDSQATSEPFEIVDVTNAQQIADAVKKHKVDTILHLAAVLSATGEKNPAVAWNINMNGLYNVLEVARENQCAVCTPSSIAVFGPSTPKDQTPQDTVMRPTTIYGVTKVAGELLCDYYYQKYQLDTRGVRFPGIISSVALPGGGTTDYAVHIYYEALKNKKYSCFLDKGTYMDMMYMPDALEAIVQLMEADPSKLIHRNAFNITAMSFDPEEIAAEIKKHIPEFEMHYDVNPDIQKIADSWPNSLDDSEARKQWGWNPKYDLAAMTVDMLDQLSKKLNI
ncbi:L-threonine 3-dehydrogenase [Clostridium formicaceticum]|uniref:Epimerase/dehydratase n=1 Tax=Clostridium formicaceticum TaxID=1497 RepID=A0AAC9WID1_9CLOT|nr:L-threonine 3-dehydrogenase [Clostridium formicaceticum]AOY75236.1 UDP-glucose 4-epimerase [Clostridium formicaceticum]ARE89669.1 putative epimerase/dehydratase [Clostridium formicaceticum]